MLPSVIDESQSAFIKDRLITNNSIIAFEAFHTLNSSSAGNNHVALKLDMSKAFNRVEWAYLRSLMEVF